MTESDYLKDFSEGILRVIGPSEQQIVWVQPHASIRAGPQHSSALLSSGLEAMSLSNAGGVLENLRKMCARHGADPLLGRLNSLINYMNNDGIVRNLPGVSRALGLSEKGLAKIAFLADKAGKTRLVYILSWWFQDLLHPLHNRMMEWLRAQPQDGTYDQRKAITVLENWTRTGKPVWSFDLTAATDRWPKSHQKVVIHRFAGSEWADTWDYILSIKPRVNTKSDQVVTYSVGQPMGAYASWAALAMTHHCLIRKLCLDRGISTNCYLVLGDDVVINNKVIAEAYLAAVTLDLGICISQGKSLLPDRQIPGTSSGEFAKQVVRDGVNLTPISTILVDQIWNLHHWWMMTSLIADILSYTGLRIYRHDSKLWVPPLISKILDLLSKEIRTKLMILISDPTTLGRPLVKEGCPQRDIGTVHIVYDDPWANIDKHVILIYKLEELETRFQSKLQSIIKMTKSLQEGVQPGTLAKRLVLHHPAHPVKFILDNLQEVIRGMFKTIAEGQTPTDAQDVFITVDYLEKVVYGLETHRTWKDNKTLRKQMGAKQLLSLHNKCISPAAPETYDYQDW